MLLEVYSIALEIMCYKENRSGINDNHENARKQSCSQRQGDNVSVSGSCKCGKAKIK